MIVKIVGLYVLSAKVPQYMPRPIPRMSKKPIPYHCHRCHQDGEANRRYNNSPYYTVPDFCSHCGNGDHDSLPMFAYEKGFDPFTDLHPITKRSVFQDRDGNWCIECFSEWAGKLQGIAYTRQEIQWMFDHKQLVVPSSA